MTAARPCGPVCHVVEGGSATSPAEIVVHGVETCEDTAITRDRLRALAVPYLYVDLEADAKAADWVRAQNGGARVTPTVRFGPESDAVVVAEPTIERLEALLAQAGHPVRPIRATELHGAAAERPLPAEGLIGADGRPWRPTNSGRSSWAIAFLHEPSCLVCQGWSSQVATRSAALAEADTRPVFVFRAPSADLGSGGNEPEPTEGPTVVGDPSGAWQAAVAERLGAPASGVLLVLADRYLAPRGWLDDTDAGGLLGADELLAWGRLLQAECPECGGEVDWPAADA